MIILLLFLLTTWLNSHNSYETDIHKDLWRINLYMNTGISNWHILGIDTNRMSFMHLFQFDTRLLTFKHEKLIST